MVQLKIASGQNAGAIHQVRRFPCHIGRASQSDVQLSEPGVWDEHLTLDFDPVQGFIMTAHGDALASVNGWPIQSVILRNGDTIELGGSKLRFWIGEPRQASLRLRENLVWLTVAAITIFELGLILWLWR